MIIKYTGIDRPC